MADKSLTVTTTVDAAPRDAWHYYTESEHVINWNFASADWHCPRAINDLREGGDFVITMAARDGSMSFDMEGTYDTVNPPTHLAYTLNDRRRVRVDFTEEAAGRTRVAVTFDPEATNEPEVQRRGWRAILDSFARYVGAQK